MQGGLRFKSFEILKYFSGEECVNIKTDLKQTFSNWKKRKKKETIFDSQRMDGLM
jgi:hypothetical protein